MKLTNLIAIGATATVVVACTPGASSNVSTGEASQSNLAYMQAKASISISSGSTVIYSDSTPNSSLVLNAGQDYTLNLSVQNAPAGTAYAVVLTNIDQINGTPTTSPLDLGNNAFMVPSSGQYNMVLELDATGYNQLTKTYSASVLCPSPTFNAGSLNASAISVAQGSGSNLYNFSGAGVVANANGVAPYQCAWDLTGVGIVDTGFAACDQTLANQYVNYVGSRNIGVIVKDACNATFTVTSVQPLQFTEPTMPGNVFIYGQTSNATGTNPTDPRWNNVTYLATNSGGNNIVIPNYGSGSFTIQAAQDYGMPSSVKYGVSIALTGFTDTISNSGSTPNTTPTISTTNVTVKSVSYSTDQAGDESPAVVFNSNGCTLTNLVATVQFVAGQPCSTGTTGDQNGATVEVSGHLSCPHMTASNGSAIDYNGDFDGMYKLADSCSGGGQGGGGIVPIQL